jgi:hypothetical protein
VRAVDVPEGGKLAVVELFTSEGCSSCPSADLVANDLVREASRGVIVLAFHVDYWDELGWKDPWSSPHATERQQEYARARGDRGLYTPQMIVDGDRAFVGSERARAEASVNDALAAPRTASISLDLGPTTQGRVQALWTVRGAPPGASILVALTEDALVSHVTRGENSGRALRHDGTVRKFHTEALSPDGRGSIDLVVPSDVVTSSAHLVAVVSEKGTGKIACAATASLR